MKENPEGMKNKLPLLKEFLGNFQKSARKISEKTTQKMLGCCEKVRGKVLKLISNRSVERHALNILFIILPYFVVSYLIYSEFSWRQSLQEIFSLLCIYAAILFWFNDYINFGNRSSEASGKKSILPSSFSKAYFYRLIIGVTACSAPIFSFNNTWTVAIIEICFVIFVEFICIEYMSGCSLFSSKIPVYLVCDNQNDFKLIEKKLQNKYKLLNSVILSNGEESAEAIFAKLQRKLRNANRFAFFPYPRRIFYFSSSLSYSFAAQNFRKAKKDPDLQRSGAASDATAGIADTDNTTATESVGIVTPNIDHDHIAASKVVPGDLVISNLLDISARFSVPLFKLKYTEDAIRGDSFHILPYSIADIDAVSISPQEETMISDVFKDKSVWIFYDGRKCVLELIRLLSDVANLTIFCTSESLMQEMEAEFGDIFGDAQHMTQISGRFPTNTHKIKIADKSIFLSTDSKPEILFFTPFLLHLNSSEDNLKEAVIKNAFDVSEIANAALKLNVKFVFFLSTMEAFKTKNWIGATQRLGELYIQSISNRKSQTKFRIIRLPYSITDPSSLFDKAEEAIKNDSIRAATSFESADFKSEDAAQIRKENLDGLLERESRYYYNIDTIFHPFLKLIAYTLRDTYVLPDIYSIFPQSAPRNFNDVAEIACKLRGIRPNEDAGVTRIAADFYKEKSSNDSKASNSDVSGNTGANRRNNNARSGKGSNSSSASAQKRFFKRVEETSIDPAIVLTRAPTSLKYREALSLDINRIRSMSTRDIISIVFQTLNMNEEKSQNITGNFRKTSDDSQKS